MNKRFTPFNLEYTKTSSNHRDKMTPVQGIVHDLEMVEEMLVRLLYAYYSRQRFKMKINSLKKAKERLNDSIKHEKEKKENIAK
ncbi:hypothetical protein ACJMK2_002784 [Sinanodonta woodiana]|uniref:Uncharacterized protein n=1 Tax=Sinanodonta woodiana TaxID=1069815 RepID=A0ABD3XWX0_SINWO